MRLLKILAVAGTIPASSLIGNFIVNPDFSAGLDGLSGYEAFAVWSQGAAGFSSAWGLADAPVEAPGNGTAVFSMNTQLANADPFWTGATQEMTFQQNFWTPDNNAGVPAGPDLYNLEIVFTGNAVVTQPYAAGNLGQAFIQFLDQSYNSVAFVAVDVTTLGPDGAFSLTATTPADGLNIIQIGFRNSGIEGTSGQMTISNVSLTVIPEPSTYAMIFGLLGLAWVLYRRRR